MSVTELSNNHLRRESFRKFGWIFESGAGIFLRYVGMKSRFQIFVLKKIDQANVRVPLE